MIVLDVEEMIENRRPLIEFLLHLRNKCQFLKMLGKIKQRLLLHIFNTKLMFITDTMII